MARNQLNMKITKQQLKKLIKEELERVIQEASVAGDRPESVLTRAAQVSARGGGTPKASRMHPKIAALFVKTLQDAAGAVEQTSRMALKAPGAMNLYVGGTRLDGALQEARDQLLAIAEVVKKNEGEWGGQPDPADVKTTTKPKAKTAPMGQT